MKTFRSLTPDTHAIDAEIEIARRAAEQAEASIRCSPNGLEGFEESLQAARRLKALQDEKRRIIDAAIKEDENLPAVSRAVPSPLPLPFRLTEKLEAGAARKTYSEAVDVLEKEGSTTDDVIQALFDMDGIAKIEDEIDEVLEKFRDRNSARRFTQAHWVAIVRQFAIVQAHAVGALIDASIEHKKLNERLAALEARPTLKYSGVFEVKSYQPGEFVSHDGSMWHCNDATLDEVPSFSPKWTLAVKHGRDLREKGSRK